MQATPEDAFLYISPIGYRKSSSCGYCRGKGTGHSYYARVASMSPASYQALIDRCWRRSGSLLYRPNQKDACCPHYTIRLDSDRFRPIRDQRQAINRFNKYVIGDIYAKEAARLYPKSREQARKRDTEFDLVERIHESEGVSLKQPPKPAHAYSVTLEPDDFTEEKFRVFENYQQVVHQESPSSISRDGFRRFLCSSPIKREKFTAPDGRERQLGSFHQCYRLDGQLVAIGVLDLLPDCVSAVYFLYHESIHKFSPGKLGALQEIALALEGGYRWWYPGFYIHTCPKMRYKIDFSPQQILDPDTLNWIDLTKGILEKFDGHGYLDLQKGSNDTAESSPSTAGAIPMNIESNEDEITNDEDTESDEESSLFKSTMPGVPSIEEMGSVDFDKIAVRLNGGYCLAGDLFKWHSESIDDEGSAKAMVAELVAAVGLDLVNSLCLDFRRS
ncbi:arginine-tRNA-protein transferase [Hypoxylon rubiginosum]|uniref:Arginine-tRNA-protein transferase n=1 Tax=Hypoxylon rubiginosum TaxID=110542 RepID=A0ACC0DJ83_9PEZI|nr:arginine-tRNA-protein transferase [Hypoxylon rubiginosum]